MSERIAWLNDLIRLEIRLWDRVDTRLRAAHDLPLARFQALYALAGGPMRVGDLAQRMSITVGGASKVADRMVTLGLLAREPDPADRRASRVALTEPGRRALDAASGTYADCLAEIVDSVLSAGDRKRMHDLVRRLLAALDDPVARREEALSAREEALGDPVAGRQEALDDPVAGRKEALDDRREEV